MGDGASPTHEDSISLVFPSDALSSYLPLAFSPLFLCGFVPLFVWFIFFSFLYLNLYLLFRLLLNLSVISKRKKNCQKKQQKHQVS